MTEEKDEFDGQEMTEDALIKAYEDEAIRLALGGDLKDIQKWLEAQAILDELEEPE